MLPACPNPIRRAPFLSAHTNAGVSSLVPSSPPLPILLIPLSFLLLHFSPFSFSLILSLMSFSVLFSLCSPLAFHLVLPLPSFFSFAFPPFHPPVPLSLSLASSYLLCLSLQQASEAVATETEAQQKLCSAFRMLLTMMTQIMLISRIS